MCETALLLLQTACRTVTEAPPKSNWLQAYNLEPITLAE